MKKILFLFLFIPSLAFGQSVMPLDLTVEGKVAVTGTIEAQGVTATEGTFTTVNYTSLNPPISIDTSDLVPYTGADKDIDLGANALSCGVSNLNGAVNIGAYDVNINGETAARQILQGRRTTANVLGRDLIIQAGGATAGATNKAGGSLTLKGGQSTGLGGSSIIFQTTPKGSTGTADNAYSTAMTITGNEIGVGTTPNVAYAVSISTANAGGLNSNPTMSNPTGSSGTREINILSGTFSDATPPGDEFVRGVKTSMYFSGAAGGYDHAVSGGYFEGGYVSMGFSDAFPGGGKHLAIGGMFSGYVMDYGMGAGNRFDDDLTQIGGWFTVSNTPAGTGAKNQLGAYFEYDSLVQTGKKLLFEGTINLSTKVATIGDSYLIFNSASTDMDWYVDGTQVMNVDNDLLDIKTEVKAAGVTSDGTGKVVCVKSDGNLGTCTDAPNASGVCTCS